MERGAMTRAAAMTSSMEMLPLCWMFFTFFRSLGGQRAGCSNFTSYCPQVDVLHLSGVEFRSHLKCWRDLELVDEVK